MSTQITTGTRLATDVQPEVGRETVWEIDPTHTLVEFTVKHMIFSRVRGRFNVARGSITCADESDPTRSTVWADLDPAASMSTPIVAKISLAMTVAPAPSTQLPRPAHTPVGVRRPQKASDWVYWQSLCHLGVPLLKIFA